MADVGDAEGGFNAICRLVDFFIGELEYGVEDEMGYRWVGGGGEVLGECADVGEVGEVEGQERDILLPEDAVDSCCCGVGIGA